MDNIVELPFKPVCLYGFKDGVGILLAQWNIDPEQREELTIAVLKEIKESEDTLIIQSTLFNKEAFDYFKVI